MRRRLAAYFEFERHGTGFRVEALAGVATFLTMAYILFLQPAILSGRLFGIETGMDFGAVTVATCLSAALATAIMGIGARLPIALAPGMGENFFFVLTAIPAAAALGHPEPWRAALGAVFVAGLLFLGLSILGIRRQLIDTVSPSLKYSMAAGIGVLIAFLGLQNAGVILKDPGTAVKLNAQFASPDRLIFGLGLLTTGVLLARRVRGAVLWGIVAAGAGTVACRLCVPLLPETWQQGGTLQTSLLMTRFQWAEAIVAAPPSLGPTLGKMDVLAALSLPMLPLVVVFLFMDVFDTMGTLIGVSEQAGLVQEGRLPRANQALMADAVGTVAGAAMGTSTVTSFIESAAGVEQGGRTGFAALTTAALFLVALFFSPIIAMVASYPPMTAPALVAVGALMMRSVTRIDWNDFSESLPAFLIVIGIPLTSSVGDGLALGFVAYPVIKLLAGRGREVRWPLYVVALALVLYFLLIRSRLG
ncbi:MAG: NCS2 family permease [Verrucomicrobiales bacterium]|nr:NCS2 family permease [Verrucomicrobiales bacterium]MCP5527804.1 NCS2 family permease [Verrucomicrobiales bacterium]